MQTMEPPLVSIVTPSLNQAATIEATLRSVRSQTYPRIEHIVIDGGSTDGTIEILERAERTNDLRWRSGPDDGMYDAVNAGMRLAAGEVVTYLNSDDILLPWAVESAVGALERTRADLVFGDALRLDEVTSRLEVKLQIPFDVRRLAEHGSLVQPAVFWRRSLADSLDGFDARLQYVGDLDYWLRAGRSAVITRIEEVLALYRTHPDAKTSRSKAAMRSEEMIVRRRYRRDGRSSIVRHLLARVLHGVAVRRQLLRFGLAGRSGTGWAHFRAEAKPTIVWPRFWLAFLPLAGRLPVQHFIALGRRPWEESDR
jgi:glycosyltransferase involved in cell wall biosynthesis